MPSDLLRPRIFLSTAVTAFFLILCAPGAHATLSWTPQNGWQVTGAQAAHYVASQEDTAALPLMNQAREAEEAGKKSRAIRAYQKLAKEHKASVYTPEAHFRLGRLWMGEHRFYKAFDTLQVIIEKYPNYERFDATIGLQYQIASALVNGQRNRALGLFPFFKDRSRGVEYLEKIVKTAPYSEYAPLSLMTIARFGQKIGETDSAIDALDRMVNDYPQSFLAPDAYIGLAKANADLVQGPQYDQASTQQALTYYQDFLILFPNDPSVKTAQDGLADMRTMLAESKMQVARFYDHYRSNYTAARVFYNEAITIYPDSPIAARARERLDKIDAIQEGHTPEPRKGAPEPAAPAKKRFWLF